MSTHDGFSLFGPDHLAALAAVGVAGLLCIVAARRGGARWRRGTGRLVALTLAAAHATEYVVAWWQGWYTRDMLPLQLCDVAALLAVWALLTEDRRAIEPLYFFALSGTLPALVTPELDVGFPELRFVVYFAEHGLTVVAPLLLVIGLGHRPRPGAWRRAVVQVNSLAAAAALANHALGTNFLYLSGKPAGPTPFDLFGPWPYYVLVLEVLVLVVFRLLQAIADLTLAPSALSSRQSHEDPEPVPGSPRSRPGGARCRRRLGDPGVRATA
jgi:hypothetical integral membrane protein (TIGR02206 family)